MTVTVSSTVGSPVFSQADGYDIYKFTGSGSVTFGSGGDVEYLVVAGGGSGAHARQTQGGGGGAGGMLTGTLTVTAGTETVTVGAGGLSVAAVNNGGANTAGLPGGDSTFASITSTGGGAGSVRSGDSNANKDGGSGGGAANLRYSHGSGIPGQGHDGGNADSSTLKGTGGGGAGGPGSDTLEQATISGGVGLASSITGTSVMYAGGGARSGASTWLGGDGGGGNSANINNDAQQGTDGLGGGGGAGSCNASQGGSSGKGGDGIVIIRFPTPVSGSDLSGSVDSPAATAAGNINILVSGSLDAVGYLPEVSATGSSFHNLALAIESVHPETDGSVDLFYAASVAIDSTEFETNGSINLSYEGSGSIVSTSFTASGLIGFGFPFSIDLEAPFPETNGVITLPIDLLGGVENTLPILSISLEISASFDVPGRLSFVEFSANEARMISSSKNKALMVHQGQTYEIGVYPMDAFHLTAGDTSPAMKFQLLDGEETAIDLTGAAVRFIASNPSTNLEVISDAAVIEDALTGMVSYSWTSVLNNSGIYYGKFHVTYPGGTKETFPNSGNILVKVQD